MEKILIVEKHTSKEYLTHHNRWKDVKKERQEKLSAQHEEHTSIKQFVIKLLEKNNLEYKKVKDSDLRPEHYKEITLIISLGGDGTFLHAVKHATKQQVIGINTDIKNSVGFLTKHNKDTIEKAIQNFQNKTNKIEKWDRVTATVDGKKLPFKALNELIITMPEIYKTSRLHIKHKDKQVHTMGNGIIATTNKGSNGFFRSAGGTPFSAKGLGYVILLPYKMEGTMQHNQQVLKHDQELIVTPTRSDHIIVFDGDEKRAIVLKQESVVHIHIHKDDELNVIIE